jgi:hypothetical protein
MKKIILVIWLACWVLGTAAQEKKAVITPVKKGEEPQAVMDALKKDFPNTMVENLSFLPRKLYGEEWNIFIEGDENADPSFFEVRVKKENEFYTAVYNKSGKLLSSKHIIQNAALPKEVLETVKKFAGWHMDKVQEIIEYRNNDLTNVYKIKLQQGMKHKNVFINAKGEIVNERIVFNIG